VIVVLSSVPSTRTVLPSVTALFEAVAVPCSYLVDDVSLMVTFSPVGVVRVKPDVDALLTVPIDPPAAGPDRAFDPPAPDPDGPGRPPECAPAGAVVAGAVAAGLELLLEAALTIPNVPAPITMVAMPAARDLVDLRERVSLRESIGRAPFG
jgi:hypothetical protein